MGRRPLEIDKILMDMVLTDDTSAKKKLAKKSNKSRNSLKTLKSKKVTRKNIALKSLTCRQFVKI